MKLFDYHCDTCDKVFEQMTDDLKQLPCTAPACAGTASRQLGGKPAFGRSSPSPNMGQGYDMHGEYMGSRVVGSALLRNKETGEHQTVPLQEALYRIHKVPKDKA